MVVVQVEDARSEVHSGGMVFRLVDGHQVSVELVFEVFHRMDAQIEVSTKELSAVVYQS